MADKLVRLLNNNDDVLHPETELKVVTKTAGTGIVFNENEASVDADTVIDMLSPNPVTPGKVLTSEVFRGALSTGKAVDVTSAPDGITGDYKGELTVTGTTLGFAAFPKFAQNLVYIMMADLTPAATGTVTPSGTWMDGTSTAITLTKDTTTRVAMLFTSSATTCGATFTFAGTGNVTVTNLREFEVTGCSKEARDYIAQLANPDDWTKFYLVDYDEQNPWTYIIQMGTAPAITLMSGLAYDVDARTGSHEISVDTCPAGYYGQDTHLKIFVGDTASVTFKPPLSLMSPLTPNAGHNITVKYRDGQALAYVDDTDIGYVVTVTSGTGEGSLAYGLTHDTSEYILFSSTTDGTACGVSGVTASDRVTLIGNGYGSTIVDGLTVASSTSANNVSFIGITLTNGSVTVNGSGVFTATNCSFQGNTTSGVVTIATTSTTKPTEISESLFDNLVYTGSGTAAVVSVTSGEVILSGCTFSSVIDNALIGVAVSGTGSVTVSGCVFANSGIAISNTTTVLVTGAGTLNTSVAGTGLYQFKQGSLSGTGTIALTGSTNAAALHDFTFDGITITGGSYSHAAVTVAGVSTLKDVTTIGNTAVQADGTLAITGSTSAVGVPVASVETTFGSTLNISGGSYTDIQLNGSTISASISGTVALTGKFYSYGTGGDLNIANGTTIDMTGNTNTTAIQPGGSVIVGSGVKAVATGGSTVNVTAGTYTSISNQGVPSNTDPIYGFHRDILLNNDTVEFIQLTDDTASGASKYTTISAADWKELKKDLLETRACVMYSTKTPAAGQKKNTVMFYLDNADFRYKENGQALTADELLGKVMWNGSLRLCNFMKIFPKMWMRVDEWGDKIVFSQTTSNANSAVAFVRDTTQDNGTYKAWKHSTAGTLWTASDAPATGDDTYSNNTGSTKRDYTVSAYRLQHFAVLVHKKPVSDFYLHPWFWTSEDGQTASDQYVGMFRGVACDANGDIIQPAAVTDFRSMTPPAIGTGMIRSIPGGRPAASQTLNNFRLYAAKAGVDLTNGFFDSYKNLMMVFDTGHYNAQTWIGEGQNLMQAYYWFELRNTGRCMAFGNRTCQLNADPTLDADIAAYWQGRITSKANSGDTSLTTWTRNPANDKVTNNVVNAYAWTAKISGTDTYIWTAAAEPTADDATYSDNTLSTVRSGCPVGAYTNNAGSRRISVSWRGLEDMWGGLWEFRDGIQKRQDATAIHAGGSYTESGLTITNAISRYSSTDEFPAPSMTTGDLPTQRTISVLGGTVYGNVNTELVNDWDVRSGTGTGQQLCFVNLPWPKLSGSVNLWDPVLGFTTMVAASVLGSAVGDSFYNDANAGSRVILVGGGVTHGGNAGPSYFYVNNSLGYAAASFGVRPAASEN